MIGLLFVCFGNICRSPALMGYMQSIIKKRGKEGVVIVDSCGLYGSFLGAYPDPRMQEEAKKKGIKLTHQAKIFEPLFFEIYNGIFGVTREVVGHLHELARSNEEKKKIYHATDFSEKYQGSDILDPYYHESPAFEKTWEMIEDSCEGIYNHFLK